MEKLQWLTDKNNFSFGGYQIFIDEETLTKEELQNAETQEQTEQRMKQYYDKLEEMNGQTEE